MGSMGFRDGTSVLGLLCSAEDQHKEHSFPCLAGDASIPGYMPPISFLPEPGEVGIPKQEREDEVTYLSKSEGSECSWN